MPAPGVVLVLTYRNAPEQGTGNHHVAHPVLTSPEVPYYGLPVAFVVAETFEEARAAAYLVRVNGAPGRFALRSGLGTRRAERGEPTLQADSRYRRVAGLRDEHGLVRGLQACDPRPSWRARSWPT